MRGNMNPKTMLALLWVAAASVGLLIAGVPLVLFRSLGRAGALVDRCPHRNVPLSLGRVLPDGRLECAYHGWQFDTAGNCIDMPNEPEEAE